MLERRWVRWGLIFLGWTFLGLFFASQTYMTYLYANPDGNIPGWLISKISLSEWYLWAVLTPLVLWLAHRFPLERGRWLVGLAVHIPAALILTVVKIQAEQLVRMHLLALPGQINVVGKLHSNFLTYWVIVGISLGFAYYRRYRERELRASQLEARLAEAQLEALRMQLHPHFLFNTLHAISTLLHRDPQAADRMIAQLSDLLRLTLDTVGVQEVPLKQELEFLDRYLEIEKTRFADRLHVVTSIQPETLDARVPYLILQPLVENAIRHAIAPRAEGGRIEISARQSGGHLYVEVRDDGPGLPREAPAAAKEGLGLSNTRARLEQLYGSAQHIELANAVKGGLTVTVTIPFRREQAPLAPAMS